jgi:hypothetical protein
LGAAAALASVTAKNREGAARHGAGGAFDVPEALDFRRLGN